MSTRKQLKSLVGARRGVLVPGAFNALSAKVIEDWAAPVSPDTLDGNMCPGENDGNEKEVHGRVQA